MKAAGLWAAEVILRGKLNQTNIVLQMQFVPLPRRSLILAMCLSATTDLLGTGLTRLLAPCLRFVDKTAVFLQFFHAATLSICASMRQKAYLCKSTPLNKHVVVESNELHELSSVWKEWTMNPAEQHIDVTLASRLIENLLFGSILLTCRIHPPDFHSVNLTAAGLKSCFVSCHCHLFFP
jgi:hypothetical protein